VVCKVPHVDHAASGAGDELAELGRRDLAAVTVSDLVALRG
jgi:hypothetical protein